MTVKRAVKILKAAEAKSDKYLEDDDASVLDELGLISWNVGEEHDELTAHGRQWLKQLMKE